MATLFPSPPKPPQNLSPKLCCSSRRAFAVGNAAASMVSLTLALSLPEISSPSPALSIAEPEAAPPRRPLLTGISSTKSWLQFYGDGFSIRVPPRFEDIMEPEDFSAGLSLYGDKVKPKTFAARFASPDGSEVVSVVIKPSNQLKITFLEAKDIKDLGSLKEAAKIFVPRGANLYSARTIKIREDETIRSYYFYEFGVDDQHVALVAAVNNGKTYIAGATAPQLKWENDGVKLRSAAISLSVL
ncbi:hypothetical protein J5N97_013052 [Dioscorea zingiberensis]|uniref:PsbP C-terminal domain-containing protein n=1 Tax=Dioscorea zingiberensis TaxID=325984 RepID=A0A9D5CQI6_9LILI|nr:hypothetical protein J5N97_013052 [Dioscorea zingiberensis]